MHPNTPGREDDLSDVASRLSGWRPNANGLDADAVLFAAGFATGRRGQGRFLAPAVCALMTILAVGLGVWGLSERAERQSLANRIRERVADPGANSGREFEPVPETAYTSSPNDYLHLYRRLEQDPSGSLASLQPAGPRSVGPPPQPMIVTPRERDRLSEQ